jgi:hypothetical protein
MNWEREWGDFGGWMIAGGVISLIVSRLCLWLASSLGDSRMRILVAHAVTLIVSVTVMSFGLSFGGDPQFLRGVMLAAPPQVIWVVMDLAAQRRRQRARLAAEAEAADPSEA